MMMMMMLLLILLMLMMKLGRVVCENSQILASRKLKCLIREKRQTHFSASDLG